MEILFGTTNSAKQETMRRRLDGMGLEILSLRDFASVPEVQEAGRDPLQNARTKAWTYWRFYHRPVFPAIRGYGFGNFRSIFSPAYMFEDEMDIVWRMRK